jgi:DnaJ-class molecular chaperone
MLINFSLIRRSKQYNINIIRLYFYKRDVDHYKVLGLDSKKEYSNEDIKNAYFQQAQKHHPDINKNKDASLRFQLIGNAYEELKSKEKRFQLLETSTTSGFDEWKTHEGVKYENNNGSNSYGYYIFERFIHPRYLIGFVLPLGIIVYWISNR